MSGLKESFDRANPNTVMDGFRKIKIGQTLRQDLKQTVRNVSPDALGASDYELATLDAVVLPDDAKAGTLLRVWARTGTAAVGELTVATRHATPSTTEAAVSPAGNIVFLATDAYTDVDIEYLAERGDVVELTVPVVPGTGIMTLPDSVSGKAVTLIEAESLVGTLTGKLIVLTPAAAAVATTKAALSIDATKVYFAVADAVSSARVKLLVHADADLNALLEDADEELI